MKKINLSFLILCFALCSFSQNIDSLKAILKTDLVDTNRIKTLILIGENTYMGSQDTALKYWNIGLDECSKYLDKNPKDTFGNVNMAAIISNIGVVYYYRGQMDTVVELWTKAAEIEASVGYDKGTIGTYNNMAQIEINQGNVLKGKEYLEKALEISYKYKDDYHIVKIKSNIAYCYYLFGMMEKAIELYESSNRLFNQSKLKKTNPELGAYNYGGLYIIYLKIDEYEKAYEFLLKERAIFRKTNNIREFIETINNEAQILNQTNDNYKSIALYKKAAFKFDSIQYKRGKAVALNNIGVVFNKLNLFDSAIAYSHIALPILKEINYQNGIGSSYHVISKSFLGKNNIDSALYYCEKAYDIGASIGLIEDVQQTSITLSNIYNQKKDFEKSLKYYKIYKLYSDSLYNNTLRSKALKSEFEFEFEAKEIQNQKEQEKKEAIAAEQDLRQKIIIGGIIIVLILVIIFTYIIYSRLKITRQQKSIIEDQKKDVEEKNIEIMASISYAKRIQEAILPHKKLVEKYMKNSFILYIPKDIVSGDFYWMEHTEDTLLFAAVDCTGHGVPGAFMSIVGNNGLNKAVREQKIIQPSKILDSLNAHVVESLQQEGDKEVKDGMDISLCSLNFTNKMLEFSGAMNPLYIVRNNEIIQTKGDKQAIGLADKEFTNHSIQLEEGDSIYSFTDGLPDQFGGPKGKKFTYKKMRELFIDIQKDSPEIRREKIKSSLKEWQGGEEQVDDICIIGVMI